MVANASLFSELSDDDNTAFLQYVTEKMQIHVVKDDDSDPTPSSVEHLRILLRQAVKAFHLSEDVVEFFSQATSISTYSQAKSYLAHIEALTDFGVLQNARMSAMQVFTSVEILPSYKNEIRVLVNRLKIIVDKSEWPLERRESLQKKLNVFLRDLEMDRTRLSALTAALVQVSGAVGESADKLRPAVDMFERIMKSVGVGSKEAPGLPGLDEQRLLAPPQAEVREV